MTEVSKCRMCGLLIRNKNVLETQFMDRPANRNAYPDPGTRANEILDPNYKHSMRNRPWHTCANGNVGFCEYIGFEDVANGPTGGQE